MKEIWKFPLTHTLTNEVEIPEDFQALTVQLQNDIPVLWAIVNPESNRIKIKIETLLTGSSIEDDFIDSLIYISTAQHKEGIVTHYFLNMEIE